MHNLESIPAQTDQERLRQLGSMLAEKKWSGNPVSDQELLEHMARLQVGITTATEAPLEVLKTPHAQQQTEPERHLAHVA